MTINSDHAVLAKSEDKIIVEQKQAQTKAVGNPIQCSVGDTDEDMSPTPAHDEVVPEFDPGDGEV